MNPCFFTAPSPLHMFAIVGVQGFALYRAATYFFGVQTFTRQTSCRNAQVRVSKNCAIYNTS